MEDRTNSALRLGPDPATAALDDALTNRQSNAGAGILTSFKPCKQFEDTFSMSLIEANSIVSDRELPFLSLKPSRDMNLRGRFAPVLDGVSNQVLQNEGQ